MPKRSHFEHGGMTTGDDPESKEQRAIDECRRLFLIAAAKHPKIRLALELRERVLIPTQKLWSKLGLPARDKPPSQWRPKHWQALESWNPEQERLLQDWMTDFHLNFDWVLSEAVEQLANWRSFPEQEEAFTWLIGYRAPRVFLDPCFFDHESEKKYRRRMKDRFESVLEAHVRDVKRLRGQFLPDRGSRRTHYCWAAEHVCLGRTWSDIAKVHAVPISWQAIQKAVTPILKRIGIPTGTT